MPVFETPDGRYLIAWETKGEGDGNSVVYDKWRRTSEGGILPIWDRWNYEANLGPINPLNPIPPTPPNPPDNPTPIDPGVVSHNRPLRNIRVTFPNDGIVTNRMVSYWPNGFIKGNYIYVLVGFTDFQPKLFRVNRDTSQSIRVELLVPYMGTAEGWYWDQFGWLYIPDGPRLMRVNPFNGEIKQVFDATSICPDCDIWQAHSSDDGQVHSATIRRRGDGKYTGTYVNYHGDERYYEARQRLDESAVTTNGEYLIIKEGDDNRIITLRTGEERFISQVDGAVGHSDCGPNFVVGEDDSHGACVVWDLSKPLTEQNRRELYHTWNMGHISYRGGRYLLSNDNILGLLDPNGAGLIPLFNHGMSPGNYDHQVQSNLVLTGEACCYVSDVSGEFAAYVLDGIP